MAFCGRRSVCRWDGWSSPLRDLLHAVTYIGGNGAFNIKNETCVSKEQTNVFFCFLLWWLYFSFIDGVGSK